MADSTLGQVAETLPRLFDFSISTGIMAIACIAMGVVIYKMMNNITSLQETIHSKDKDHAATISALHESYQTRITQLYEGQRVQMVEVQKATVDKVAEMMSMTTRMVDRIVIYIEAAAPRDARPLGQTSMLQPPIGRT